MGPDCLLIAYRCTRTNPLTDCLLIVYRCTLRSGVSIAAGQTEPAQGRAVQLDPMKPKLKLPGTKRLKLKRDILLSNSAFKFNLRRYIKRIQFIADVYKCPVGAYTPSRFRST